MNFNQLVLEELIVPKLKRGMKVRLPDEIVNRDWHSIKDPYGYITNIKKGSVQPSGFTYRVEYIDASKMTRQRQKAMKEVCKYSTKYSTNGYFYIDGKLLEDTNKELLIKNDLIKHHGMSDEEASSNANTIAKL